MTKKFRKATPPRVKTFIYERESGICQDCKEKVADVRDQEFHHEPPLALRFDSETKTFDPPQHDPNYILLLCKWCHHARTHGTHGDLKRGGDLGEIRLMKKKLKKYKADVKKRNQAAWRASSKICRAKKKAERDAAGWKPKPRYKFPKKERPQQIPVGGESNDVKFSIGNVFGPPPDNYVREVEDKSDVITWED
jgi:hypothetical protein